jgi:hypothetical protein
MSQSQHLSLVMVPVQLRRLDRYIVIHHVNLGPEICKLYTNAKGHTR